MAESVPSTKSKLIASSARTGNSCPPHQFGEISAGGRPRVVAAAFPERQAATDDRLCDASSRSIAVLPDWRMKTLVCDVVLPCRQGSSAAERSIRSILDQRGIQVVLHLVDDGGGADSFINSFRNHPNVVLHRNRRELGPWQTLHSLIPVLKTPYVAVQNANCESSLDRLGIAVSALEYHGGEIFASSLSTPTGLIQPVRPSDPFRRYLPSEGLVFRRSTLVDLNGFADRPFDADADLVYRASRDGRRIIAHVEPLVTQRDHDFAHSVSLHPTHSATTASFDQTGVGFAQHSVACDVVLPFHGQLTFVRQAIESILQQQGAEIVLHLIDDASPMNTDSFLRFWQSHPQVRTYRNKVNLGQYTSFNNVVGFCETQLVAVQDGDDVSCRKRLFQSGNHLRLSGADIFGGALIGFEGDFSTQTERTATASQEPAEVNEQTASADLNSRYPVWDGAIEHFLFNGSAMMRLDAFRQLGGFSDYGTTARNRCNLDTEFYARAYFSGMSVAVTREVVSWCRKHPASATRNPLTGWGTAIRTENVEETRRRVESWRRVPCRAKNYGAIGRYETATEAWPERRKTFSEPPQNITALPTYKTSLEPLC